MKKSVISHLFLVLLLTLSFTACDFFNGLFGIDDEDESQPTTCACPNGTSHDAACACGADICDCVVNHTGAINAFNRTIAVRGDGHISAADFNAAKANLEAAMERTFNAVAGIPTFLAKYVVMLDRDGFAIIIVTGDSGPAAKVAEHLGFTAAALAEIIKR
jgi:hypothetical protein